MRLSDGSVAGSWRLPNRGELLSLLYNGAGLPLDHPFTPPEETEDYYWSSTTYPYIPSTAWVIRIFEDGADDRYAKADNGHRRSMRQLIFEQCASVPNNPLHSSHQLRIHDTLQTLSDRVAAAVAGAVHDAVGQRGRCWLLLAGGSTPRTTYELLATRYRDDVPWKHVHLFWGDERFLPPDDPRSNARMAREALVDRVPCPPANVHPIPTELPSADAAALRYENTLRAHFSGDRPVFDLVLLGLGKDAHTASIFPGSPALAAADRWVMAVTAPVEPALRVTLTMRALTAAAKLFVLVAGPEKAAALQHALDPAADSARYPAAALRQAGGRVTWWVDRTAAPDSGG